MPDLDRLLAEFGAALDDPSDTRVQRRLAGGARRGLAIYRANVAAGAERALETAYPVLKQLVGDEFFAALAHRYRAAWPSTSGDLNDFGGRMAEFLAGFEPAAGLPYLPDLARLEWAAHRAYGAADAATPDLEALAAATGGDPSGLRFEWAPGTALVASPHPVARMWEIHQPGYDGEFGIEGFGAQAALVAREGDRVRVRALAAGEAAFVAAALAGADFAHAAGAALAADPATDLGGLLGTLLAAGALCGLATQHKD